MPLSTHATCNLCRRDFRIMACYQSEEPALFNCAFDVLDWVWDKSFMDVTFWFGECPVIPIQELKYPAVKSELKEFLLLAFSLAYHKLPGRSDILPVNLGVKIGSDEPRYILRVGSLHKDGDAVYSYNIDQHAPDCIGMFNDHRLWLRDSVHPDGSVHHYYYIWEYAMLTSPPPQVLRLWMQQCKKKMAEG